MATVKRRRRALTVEWRLKGGKPWGGTLAHLISARFSLVSELNCLITGSFNRFKSWALPRWRAAAAAAAMHTKREKEAELFHFARWYFSIANNIYIIDPAGGSLSLPYRSDSDEKKIRNKPIWWWSIRDRRCCFVAFFGNISRSRPISVEKRYETRVLWEKETHRRDQKTIGTQETITFRRRRRRRRRCFVGFFSTTSNPILFGGDYYSISLSSSTFSLARL